MSGGGGRPVRPLALLLLAAMLALNGALVALNLQKHRSWPFDGEGGDDAAGSTPETVSTTEPASPSVEESAVESATGAGRRPDIDDWPGGRGPVPPGPPVPRRVLLRTDGTAQLQGSAPSWAVATELAGSIASHVPSGLVGVDIDMTWHPDAVGQTTGGAVVIDPPIVYESGQLSGTEEVGPALDLAATMLAGNPSLLLTVVAHIDDLGDSDENAAVAVARASAVVSELEFRGVAPARTVVVVAPADPSAAANDSNEARAFNRRVELRLENLLIDREPLTVGRAAVDQAENAGDGQSAPQWSIDDVLAADPACSDPVAASALRIAYAADLSPLGRPVDGPGSESAQHLSRLINCAGGVDGRAVEVSVFDVGGTPLAARRSLGQLVQWEPDVVIGPRFAGPGLRLLERLAGSVPVVFPVSTESALADPSRSSYLVSADGHEVGTAAARLALDQGWRTAATVAAPGPDTGVVSSAFADAFAAGGGIVRTPVELEPSGDGGTLSEVVARLADDPEADVVFADLPPSQFVALRDGAAAAGIDAVFVNVHPSALSELWTDPGAVGGTAGSAGGGATLEGSHAIVVGATGPGRRSNLLDQTLRDATDADARNGLAAAGVGDALAVIIEAHLQGGGGTEAGGTGGSSLAATLGHGLTAEGIRGTLRYTGAGSPAVGISLVQVIDGEAVTVATFEP